MHLFKLTQKNFLKTCKNKEVTYIPSVWPGKETERYVSRLLMRLSSVGSLYLGLISLIPLVASAVWGLDESIGLGGTSLLIVVGVTIQTINQLNGMMMKQEYVGFIRE